MRFYLILLGLLVSLNARSGELNYPTACPNNLDKIKNIACGSISVPENHQTNTNKKIKLFFVIANSFNKSTTHNPIFYMIGGPGAAPSSNLKALLQEINILRKHHSIIFVDERGTGYSTPKLTCDFKFLDTENNYKKKLSECNKQFADQQINIADYNSYQDAQDIIALAKSLHLKNWNLLGNSYGTKLALAISQFQPKGLRSIVLDSALSLQPFNIKDISTSSKNNFMKLFNYCKHSSICNQTFPDLHKHYLELIQSLPASLKPDELYLTKQMVIMQTSSNLIGHSDYLHTAQKIENLYNVKRNGKLTLQKFKDIYHIKNFVSDLGVMKVMSCYDEQEKDFVVKQNAQITEANKNFPYFYTTIKESGIIDCKYLGHGDALQIIRKKLITTVPVLILHGANDSIPLYISKEIKNSLNNAKIYIFEGEGHHVLGNSNCAKEIVNEFFDEPHNWPQKNC